jgi:acetolactate decarboxylase
MHMQSKNMWFLIVVLTLVVCIVFYAIWQFQYNTNATVDRETLFQVAAFNTFSLGNYDGYMSYHELAEHGDFGIGTFDGLDGEMVALDGVFYQIPFDGKPKQVDFNIKTPYATVTFFEADTTVNVANPLNYSELKTYIDKILLTDNAIYAIKISGIYDYAQVRSVPMQTKPYPPIAEVIENQSTFELNNISGTAVGFWFPSSMDGVDFAGYHLHLITDNETAGGHLLDCIVGNITIEIDQTNKYNLVLP